MQSASPALFSTLLDAEHFESLARYRPGPEYSDRARARLGQGWTVTPAGFWTHAIPPRKGLGQQGWKIHISATLDTAEEVMDLLVPLFASETVPFKFASDRRMHALSLSKNWPRTGAGKFITVYPHNDEHFLHLVAECDRLTRHLNGPYILSDRPYRDSKAVFYRYGEHLGWPSVNAEGQRAAVLIAPDGREVTDERLPYYAIPDWVTDPFGGTEVPAPGEDGILLNGRYRVIGAERYSSIGGIYTAEDTATDQLVIIREARPFVGNHHGAYDGPKILEKEARILQRLESTGYTAHFVELFQEWEHWFLVQTKLDAESLWGYAINFYFGDNQARTPDALFERIRETIRKIATGLTAVHSRGVVLRDLTRSNVMFSRATDEVRFIDFELAYELDGDEPPVLGWTPGYASPEQLRGATPTPAEDYYGFGALVLDMLAFTAPGLSLDRTAVLNGLSLILDDKGLPTALREIIEGLAANDPLERWNLRRAIKILDQPPQIRKPQVSLSPGRTVRVRPTSNIPIKAEIERTIQGIAEHIRSVADFTRNDRLFPASPEVFWTNPVNFQYGSSGVSYFLWRATGILPDDAIQWTLNHLDTNKCPPGLYAGYGGVALALLEFGMLDSAVAVMERANKPDSLYGVPGLYYGIAGWGLVQLHFWRRTGEDRYLSNAVSATEHLLRTLQRDDDGVYWETRGSIPLGLGDGASGIAVFLLYMYSATGNEHLLATARDALRFEIANGDKTGDWLVWSTHKGAAASGPKSPHMRHGTAGVSSAVLRYFAVTGDEEFLGLAELCGASVATRFTNKLWHDYGLAGFGEYLIDMYHFLGERRYLDAAYHVAEALLAYRIQRGSGYAFAGLEMLRTSCDFGFGSAGIGVFLHRLLHPETPRALFLDELLDTAAVSQVSGGVTAQRSVAAGAPQPTL